MEHDACVNCGTCLRSCPYHGIGPCLFIDTPGFDDEGTLGVQRVKRTEKALEKADVALLFCGGDMQQELLWMKRLEAKKIPVILLLNKADILSDVHNAVMEIKELCGVKPLVVSAKQKRGMLEFAFVALRGYRDCPILLQWGR